MRRVDLPYTEFILDIFPLKGNDMSIEEEKARADVILLMHGIDLVYGPLSNLVDKSNRLLTPPEAVFINTLLEADDPSLFSPIAIAYPEYSSELTTELFALSLKSGAYNISRWVIENRSLSACDRRLCSEFQPEGMSPWIVNLAIQGQLLKRDDELFNTLMPYIDPCKQTTFRNSLSLIDSLVVTPSLALAFTDFLLRYPSFISSSYLYWFFQHPDDIVGEVLDLLFNNKDFCEKVSLWAIIREAIQSSVFKSPEQIKNILNDERMIKYMETCPNPYRDNQDQLLRLKQELNEALRGKS